MILDAGGKVLKIHVVLSGASDPILAELWALHEQKYRGLQRQIAEMMFRPTFTVLDADGHIVASGDVQLEERSWLQ